MEGVLGSLEKLDGNAREFDLAAKEAENHERKLKLLQKKLLTLRSKKKQLCAELANSSIKSTEQVYEDEDSLKRSKLKELRQLQECFKVYRLCGVSVEKKTSTTLFLRFDTFYKKTFMEQYCMELMHTKMGNGYSVSKHTLPAFIPMSQLEKTLTEDIKLFVMKVREHLNAYITRRELIKVIESQLSERLMSEVIVSLPVDYVQFSLRTAEDGAVKVTLGYSDLTSVRPDKAEVCVLETEGTITMQPDNSVLRTWEELLRTIPLSEAVNTISGVSTDLLATSGEDYGDSLLI